MWIRLFICLIFLLPSISFAQDFDYEFLQAIQVSSAEGFVWSKMTKEQKSTYLMGYEDGYLNAVGYEIKDKDIRDNAVSKLPSFYDQNNIKRDDLIPKLDEFYGQHDAYKVFPVALALRFVIFKELGIESEIDSQQAKFFEKMLNETIEKGVKEKEGE